MEQKKIHQPPLSIEDQIKNLRGLHLIIDDEEKASSFLNDVSYFRFIKAFSISLKPKNGVYNGTTTFEDITQLYLFNSSLRQILFPVIERIEINLRCRIANYFSKKYGVLGYECPNNFRNSKYHSKFLDEIKIEIHRNTKAPFVKNFRDNYIGGKLPFYALVELFSFGVLSKFYKNLINEDKKVISSSYGISYKYFESWIESIAFVRNICAHYGRLYNAKLSKTPILYKEYSNQGIGNIRLYGVLLCIKHIISMQDPKHWSEFVETLDTLIKKYPVVNVELMGFPHNWKKLLEK